MRITMISEELAMLLEVSPKTLRNIISGGKLNDRILAKGFTLCGQYKDGKNNIYELDKTVDTSWNVIQAKYNIRDSSKEKHNKYSETRIKGMSDSRKQVIKNSETGIAYSTAKKYDDILLEEHVMEKDKNVYFLVDMETDVFTEITEYEYKTFWIGNRELKRQLDSNKRRRENYEISEDAFDYINHKTYESYGTKDGVIAIKFMTYKQAENTISVLEELRKNK